MPPRIRRRRRHPHSRAQCRRLQVHRRQMSRHRSSHNGQHPQHRPQHPSLRHNKRQRVQPAHPRLLFRHPIPAQPPSRLLRLRRTIMARKQRLRTRRRLRPRANRLRRDSRCRYYRGRRCSSHCFTPHIRSVRCEGSGCSLRGLRAAFRVSGPRFDSARRTVRRLHADKGRCLVSSPRPIVLVVTAHDRCLGSCLCARTARTSPSFSRICSA